MFYNYNICIMYTHIDQFMIMVILPNLLQIGSLGFGRSPTDRPTDRPTHLYHLYHPPVPPTCTIQQLVLAPLIWLTALCMLLGEEKPSTPSVKMSIPARVGGSHVCIFRCLYNALNVCLFTQWCVLTICRRTIIPFRAFLGNNWSASVPALMRASMLDS